MDELEESPIEKSAQSTSSGNRLGQIFLLVIIIINLFQFFNIFIGEFDYIERILSWITLGYLIYQFKLSKIFFGKENKMLDFMLILSYFSLIAKDLIVYAANSIKDSSLFFSFYMLLIDNTNEINKTSFYIGGMIIIVLAIYVTMYIKIEKPSIMSIIQEEGDVPNGFFKFAIRFTIIFLLFAFFFILIFNLMIEWLGWALDEPIIIIAILFYLFKSKDFAPNTIIYKVGNAGQDFYFKFIELFTSKNTILLGLSGILVLHLLTDIANFIIPYAINFSGEVYLRNLGRSHLPIATIVASDLLLLPALFDKAILIFLYLLNIIAIFLLLFFPSLVWYNLFKNRDIHLSKGFILTFYTSVTAFLIAPVFKLKEIKSDTFVGVDIYTNRILENLKINLPLVLLAIIAVGIIVLLLYKYETSKDLVIIASVAYCLVFFATYIYYFSTSLISYYILKIIALTQISEYFIVTLFFIFLGLSILFYIGTFIYFVYEIWR